MIPAFALNLIQQIIYDGHAAPLLVAVCLPLLIIAIGFLSRFNYGELPELALPNTRIDEDHVVVIPARDEEHTVERAVKSFPDSLVVVIDDHSGDSTGAVASAAGAEVRSAPALPKNAFGKPNACWAGARYTESKWILFVDADTWYEPDFSHAILAQARREDLVAVTVFPRPAYGTFFERALMPYVLGLRFLGVQTRKVNSAREPGALANGQCILVRRDAYEFVKGHESVLYDVADGMALARIFKRHRMPIRAMRAENFAHARMHPSLPDLWHALERQSLRSMRTSPWLGLCTAAASLVMLSWLPVAAWLAWMGYPILAGVVTAAPVVAWLPWYRNPVWAVLAPAAIVVVELISVAGRLKTLFGLPSYWKGRAV